MKMPESLLQVKNFKCKSCRAVVQESPVEIVHLDGDTLEAVEKLCCLEDRLSTDGRVHASVVFKIRVGWSKFERRSGIACGRGLS